MAHFEFVSFVIGLLLGMIIMLIIVWIAYYTRIFMFTNCPTSSKMCSGPDYFNNPGQALSNGAKLEDILYINDNGQLRYKRMPKQINCVPDFGQDVQIIYPQYCRFTDNNNNAEIYRATAFGSNIYKPASGLAGPIVTTDGNCNPVQSFYNKGTPLLRVDPVPIQD